VELSIIHLRDALNEWDKRRRGGENVNSQLKAARRARGLAIWGLSVMSGVSPSLLTAIEKWGYVPGVNTQKRIADALGLQVEDIWTRETQSSEGSGECLDSQAISRSEIGE
jgi:DNA-binding XRE family transcriptional regulator